MKRLLVTTLGCSLCFAAVSFTAPTVADAQILLSGDRPRIFSIQRRPYRLHHEIQLGLAVLPLDAYYVGMVVTAAYTYHFTDLWAWEIAGGGYSINFDTSLERRLLKDHGVAPVRGGGERIKTLASTGLVVKPLFGKLAIFNADIVFSETFFTLGVGPLMLGDLWRVAVNVGLGLRFWTGETLSIRFDVRDYVVFLEAVPENNLFLMLSASFNVSNIGARSDDEDDDNGGGW